MTQKEILNKLFWQTADAIKEIEKLGQDASEVAYCELCEMHAGLGLLLSDIYEQEELEEGISF